LIVSLIVAMDEQGGIGLQGRVPWHLATDLKHFKALTMGHHLVVGRKTFVSIGRPLPGRHMIVVTRNPDFQAESCLVAHSLEAALDLARGRGESEAFIGGGAEIYAQALPLADQIYLTQVHTVVQADTFFPDFDRSAWGRQMLFAQQADEKNGFDFEGWLLK
jgi:dihydrofolate reductase